MSFYQNTEIMGNVLDIANIPEVPMNDFDEYHTIESKHHHRPDKLSQELYGTPHFWYIFTLRNPDLIEDPIYDFTMGKEIRIPSKRTIRGL